MSYETPGPGDRVNIMVTQGVLLHGIITFYDSESLMSRLVIKTDNGQIHHLREWISLQVVKEHQGVVTQ